jgi:hypothetical protein
LEVSLFMFQRFNKIVITILDYQTSGLSVSCDANM